MKGKHYAGYNFDCHRHSAAYNGHLSIDCSCLKESALKGGRKMIIKRSEKGIAIRFLGLIFLLSILLFTAPNPGLAYSGPCPTMYAGCGLKTHPMMTSLHEISTGEEKGKAEGNLQAATIDAPMEGATFLACPIYLIPTLFLGVGLILLIALGVRQRQVGHV